MNNSDIYYTINDAKFSEIKIKGSIFIAGAYPVNNVKSAQEILKSLKSKYYDANHNCFAYRIGYDGADFRYSDDGEPSGSAGKPIYMITKKYDLSDILIVVTRYFGGTKLGVGGLVRAYSDSAEEVLRTVEKKEVHLTKNLIIECTYNDLSVVKKIIEKESVDVSEEYTDVIRFRARVHNSKADSIHPMIYDATNGRVSVLSE